MMEVFAGFMEHTDYHLGRLFAFLKSIGVFENTVIMLISDNGASSEGGPTGSVNENLFFNNVKEDLKRTWITSTRSAIQPPSTIMPGLDLAGDTPFRAGSVKPTGADQ